MRRTAGQGRILRPPGLCNIGVLGAAVALAGCGDPFVPSASRPCASTSDCLVGHLCVDRICVAVTPGGSGTGGTQSPVGGSDAGIPVRVDAGRPPMEPSTDAGPAPVDSGPGVDAGPAMVTPGVELTEESTRIVVSVDDSFEIEFAESHRWQPAVFRDRQTDPTLDLAGVPQASPKHQVFMTPLGVLIGDWITLNEVQNGTAQANQPSSDEVVVNTTFVLAGGAVSINVATEYRIYADRRIEVRVTATSASAITLGGFEFAYATLTPTHAWTTTTGSDRQSFQFAAPGGEPTIEFRTLSPTRAANVASDIPQNQYFLGAGGQVVSSSSPLELAWEVTF